MAPNFSWWPSKKVAQLWLCWPFLRFREVTNVSEITRSVCSVRMVWLQGSTVWIFNWFCNCMEWISNDPGHRWEFTTSGSGVTNFAPYEPCSPGRGWPMFTILTEDRLWEALCPSLPIPNPTRASYTITRSAPCWRQRETGGSARHEVWLLHPWQVPSEEHLTYLSLRFWVWVRGKIL